MGFLRRLRRYDALAGISEIARRYFAMNGFDGVVTMIGVLGGCLAAGVETARIVIVTGLMTAVAMGVSGLWGAYLTEHAERTRSLEQLNESMLTDLSETEIGKASRAAVVIVTIVDALSPFLSSILILSPFLFAGFFESIVTVYYLAFGLALSMLFGLGVFLGYVSQRNMFVYGLKTLLAGLVSIGVSLALHAAP